MTARLLQEWAPVILFVENDDSFSWNVLETLPFPREAVRVVRTGEALASLTGDIEQVVVGPGPKDPQRAGLIPFVHEVARRGLPYLGVCLGHQALGLAFGAELIRSVPVHGKRAWASFGASREFAHVTGRLEVMRYHSLSLTSVRSPLRVVASLDDGTVMAIEHETLPMRGVQFHPDSFGTPEGRAILGSAIATRRSPSAPPGQRVGERGKPLELSSLSHRSEFALLAPQFRNSPNWTLLDLTATNPNATLWHAKAEGAPIALRGRAEPVDLHFDVAPIALEPKLDETGFLDGVRAIREAIAAGDVYQVNLTLRAALKANATGAQILATLCRNTIPRFAAWVKSRELGEFLSASPELLVEREGRRVRVEPMKGTARPDQRAWLEASEKDRAELSMITDLLRDDLHHLCERGSVIVTNERRFIELPYVLQTVADVEGTLRSDVTTTALLAQVHPGGSVTGAPRHAALTQIAKLESSPRGAYCGALGLEFDDRLTAALLIRTAERTARGWRYGVGSGITWDSDPQAELDEVRLKLGALG
jgi:anthranilate synthase/aminodeoxychorismate synthase-like glutamine amidotransferase